MRNATTHADSWYEDSMTSREDEFCKRFGSFYPANMVIKPQDHTLEMTIPGFAFLRFPPNTNRAFWLYVTHGLSQPTELEDFEEGFQGGLSGTGVEFALATSTDENWAFSVLELVSCYALSGSRPICPLDRIPSSDLMNESIGGGLLAMSTPGYPTVFASLSGRFHLCHLVGVTAGELKKAKQYDGLVGSKILEKVLCASQVGCVTDRNRKCITKREDFAEMWSSMS